STEMKLNEKIKTIRLSKNFTQVYLAEELGIDAANYSRLERGETKISTERLLKIAEILDIDLNLLLDESEINSKKELQETNEILKQILIELKLLNKNKN